VPLPLNISFDISLFLVVALILLNLSLSSGKLILVSLLYLVAKKKLKIVIYINEYLYFDSTSLYPRQLNPTAKRFVLPNADKIKNACSFGDQEGVHSGKDISLREFANLRPAGLSAAFAREKTIKLNEVFGVRGILPVFALFKMLLRIKR
jgi:hypothetical protein